MGRNKKRNNLLHSLDSKGRVAIPVNIRRTLRFEEPLILTKGIDNCIYVYTKEEWGGLLDRFKDFPMGKSLNRKMVRKFMGEAEEVEIDLQGRILLPGHLIEYAGIKNTCYFVKMPRWFEIWNPELYKKAMKEVEPLEELEEFPL